MAALNRGLLPASVGAAASASDAPAQLPMRQAVSARRSQKSRLPCAGPASQAHTPSKLYDIAALLRDPSEKAGKA